MLAKKIKRSLNEDYQAKLSPSDIQNIVKEFRREFPEGVTPHDVLKYTSNSLEADLFQLLIALSKNNLLKYRNGNKIPPLSIEKIIDRRGTLAADAILRSDRFNEITVNKPPAPPPPIDPIYTHFALGKADNKIITGWDYKGLDRDEIKHWVKLDLKDMNLKPSNYLILSVKALKQKGIDPFKKNNWKKQK